MTGQNFGQTAQPYPAQNPGQYAAPAPSQGSGVGGALLGAGAGLVGGYLLGNALSGSDVANAAQSAADTAAAGAQSAAQSAASAVGMAQPGAAQAGAASPVTTLLGYDTAGYCTQLAQGNATVQQQCTAAEEAAMATLRNCVAMSTGLNGIGSYDALLRCLRAAPAAQTATPVAP